MYFFFLFFNFFFLFHGLLNMEMVDGTITLLGYVKTKVAAVGSIAVIFT